MECPRCHLLLSPGIVMTPTWVGRGDFHDGDEPVTLNEGGPGIVKKCLKCPECGYSIIQPKESHV